MPPACVRSGTSVLYSTDLKIPAEKSWRRSQFTPYFPAVFSLRVPFRSFFLPSPGVSMVVRRNDTRFRPPLVMHQLQVHFSLSIHVDDKGKKQKGS